MNHGIQIQYNDSFESAISAAHNAGFKYVSVGFGESDCFHRNNWQKDIAKISKILEKNSIECIQTHIPMYSLLISAEESDKDLDLAQLRCMEGSAKLGAEWKPIMNEFKKFYKGALMLEVVYPNNIPLEGYFRFCKENLEYIDSL